MRIIFASFLSHRSSQFVSEVLKTSAKYFAVQPAYRFKNALGMLLNPGDFLLCKLKKRLRMPASKTVTSSMPFKSH